MMSSEAMAQYRERLTEARLYFEKGIKDGAADILEALLSELDQSDIPDAERSAL
ncbi:MAG: hypothetical protein HGB17_08315, partial [Syntrophobacteraceae bacterium]|nr:hypothetical protein [Syntrophobacteraceae bacterium]